MQPLNLILLISFISASLIVSGCRPEGFHWWEGNNSIVVGKGATRETVEGIDIWMNGDPPRKFRVMRIVSDVRPGSIPSLPEVQREVVTKVRELGGDAGIIISASSRLASWSKPDVRTKSRYAVIKYLD